jgi:hypothetical protein
MVTVSKFRASNASMNAFRYIHSVQSTSVVQCDSAQHESSKILCLSNCLLQHVLLQTACVQSTRPGIATSRLARIQRSVCNRRAGSEVHRYASCTEETALCKLAATITYSLQEPEYCIIRTPRLANLHSKQVQFHASVSFALKHCSCSMNPIPAIKKSFMQLAI